MRYSRMILVFGFLALVSTQARAEDPRLAECLKQAAEWPDQAFARAEAWQRQGGADRADVCWAVAQVHRGENAKAAPVFSNLAKKREKQNPKQAASLHDQAGLAYMRINDNRAEGEFSTALKLSGQDADLWLDRATDRAGRGRYWDALDDAHHAVKLAPNNGDALRLRGQIWEKLGFKTNATADLAQASEKESAAKAKAK